MPGIPARMPVKAPMPKPAAPAQHAPAPSAAPTTPQQPSYFQQFAEGQLAAQGMGGMPANDNAQPMPANDNAQPQMPQRMPQQQFQQGQYQQPQQQAAPHEPGKPPEPEEMNPQQIEWEIETLEGQRVGLEGDQQTGVEGRKQQLEKHIKEKSAEVEKKQAEIDDKKVSIIRVALAYMISLILDIANVIGWATGAEAANTASVAGAGVEIAIDLAITMILFPLILPGYKKGWAFLDMIPFLDILPWYVISVFSTRRAQKKEIKDIEDSQLKPLKDELKNFKEEIGNVENQLSQIKSREKKLQGIAEEQAEQGTQGGGGGQARAPSIASKIGKGWIGARAFSGAEGAGETVLKKGFNAVTVILFIAAFAYGMTYAMPHAIASYQSGAGEQSALVAAEKTKGGLAAFTDELSRSWRKNTQIASGEYLEGQTDQTVKEFVGLQYKPPLLPNPKKTTLGEPTEMAVRLHGFGNKQQMTATTVCQLKDRDILESSTTAGTTKVDLRPGTEQTLTPGRVENQISFTEDITCYPVFSACGNYKVTFTTQADGLRTDAYLKNSFIQKKVLRDRLEAYAKEKQINLDDEGEVSSAIRSIWPELADSVSMSDKGPVKLVLLTEKTPLIGIDDKSNLKLKVGVQNEIDGWLLKIDSVTVLIPEGFIVSQGAGTAGQSFCPGWIQNGRTLTLSPEYLATTKATLNQVDRGLQKVFPSCHITLDPSSTAFMVENEPTPATFTASIVYSYIIQQKNDIEVLQADGTKCQKKKETSGGGAATTGGTGGTGTTPTTSPTTTPTSTNIPTTNPTNTPTNTETTPTQQPTQPSDNCATQQPGFTCKDIAADCPTADGTCVSGKGCYKGLCPGAATIVCCPA